MKNLKKLLSALLVVCTISVLIPIQANAAWKQNNIGWWYTEGDSWSTGWKLINGNWYYFYSDGYMAQDTTVDGYYLNSSGAWNNNSLDEQGRYKDGTIITLSGTLNKINWTHPGNGSQLSYYVLKLDTPASFNLLVNGERSIQDGLNEIQVIANYHNNDSNINKLEAKVNQHVTLKGEIWGGAGNWYYHRQATMTWLEDK